MPTGTRTWGCASSYGHDQTQQWRNGSALAYRDNKFNAQTEYALSDGTKLSLAGGLVDMNKFDGLVVATAVETGTPTLGYAYALYDRPNFFVLAYWNSYDISGPVMTDHLLSPFLSTPGRDFNAVQTMRGHTYNIETQHSIELGTTNRLTYGLNYRYNTLTSNYQGGTLESMLSWLTWLRPEEVPHPPQEG